MKVRGSEGHSGTTALQQRRDALLTAAKMIVSSNDIARAHAGLVTTGVLKLSPGSVNTIPGEVLFSLGELYDAVNDFLIIDLDIRSKADDKLAEIEGKLKDSFATIANREGQAPLEVEWTLDAQSHAISFNDRAIACVRAACDMVFGEDVDKLTTSMLSGAGHDSVYTNRRAPTAMVFIGCRGGLSHNPREFATKQDCAIGAQVLLYSILAYDSNRTTR